jgi:hypothetical protein
MVIQYVGIDNEKVSWEWSVLLHDIRDDDHVAFHVNEGHRTMARQTWFWTHQPPLAAFPSPNAPHIRTGRFWHAIDFNNAEGVRRAAAHRGVTLVRTVRGEEWHLEANADELKKYAARHKDEPVIRPYYMKPFRPNDKDAVIRLQKLLKGLNMSSVVNGKYGKWTRTAVRRFQGKHGMKIDGVVGPATWRALRKASG